MIGVVYWAHLVNMSIETEGYVGVTLDFERRKKEHLSKDVNSHFNAAIKKYKDSIVWDIIYKGDITECYKKESQYRPVPNLGWNIAVGGTTSSNFMRFLTNETKEKLSKARIGKEPWNKGKTQVYSSETLRKIADATKSRTQGKNNPMFNKNHTQEAKDKISKAHKGKIGLIGNKNPMAKSVQCLELNIIYPTISDAAKAVGVTTQALSYAIKNHKKSKGYTWLIV